MAIRKRVERRRGACVNAWRVKSRALPAAAKRYNSRIPLVPMSPLAFCSFSPGPTGETGLSIFHPLLIFLAGPLSIVHLSLFTIRPRGNFRDTGASATIPACSRPSLSLSCPSCPTFPPFFPIFFPGAKQRPPDPCQIE